MLPRIDCAAAPIPAPATPAPAPKPLAAGPPKPKVEIQHTSVYIPRPVYERLREIAFHERLKIHDLIMQGLDLVMMDRGHPERTKAP
jgi:hypothetical protein